MFSYFDDHPEFCAQFRRPESTDKDVPVNAERADVLTQALEEWAAHDHLTEWSK